MSVFLIRLLAVFTLTLNAAAASLTGHALVIGNAAYRGETPLDNTLNDARDMAAKLESLGFRVTRVENAGRRQLTSRVNDFLRTIQRSDAPALLYYSGHGMQVGGQNYLIPVDARIRDEFDVRSEGVGLGQVLSGMGGRGDKAVNLVILDACRNNPFNTTGTKSIGDKGLARVSAPGGTLILYATKPGKTASDNPGGRNGLFTKHLLQAMDETGVEVEDTFKTVAQNVYRDSHHRQTPWQEGVIFGRFYFVPPPAPPPPRPGPVLPSAIDYDYAAWQSAERCAKPACYQAYLSQYPHGRFAPMAQALLSEPQPPTAPTADPTQRIGQQLETCGAHLDANRLTTPAGRNAFDCYSALLGLDPGNTDALQGIASIERRYARWATSNLDRGRLTQAASYIERLERVSGVTETSTELKRRVHDKRAALAAEKQRRARQNAGMPSSLATPSRPLSRPAARGSDSDGDGIGDATDRCPGTPPGVLVDRAGCPLDTDGDGVPDYLDRCPSTDPEVPVDSSGCRYRFEIVIENVTFAFDSARLDLRSRSILDAALPHLLNNPRIVAVVLEGHTDSTGPQAYNQALSVRRAQSVFDYLVAHGMAANRLVVKGFGEMQPVASNATAEGRAQNNRVEINVRQK